MRGLRASLATLITVGMTVAPVWASPKTASSLGTIVTAEHALVGGSSAEAGTTVFSGDRLSTGWKAAFRFAPAKPDCCFRAAALRP